MQVLSSADVARRLMLIAKLDKWQFVVKTGARLLSVDAARSVLVGALINKYSLFLNTARVLDLFVNIRISVNIHTLEAR